MTPETEEAFGARVQVLIQNVNDGIMNEEQALSLLRAEGFDVDAILSRIGQPDRVLIAFRSVNEPVTAPGPTELFVDPENL